MKSPNMISHATGLMSEVSLTLLILFAASADLAVKMEVATPDQILILWCLIGGLIGSIVSLRIFRVKNINDGTWQLLANLGISSMVAPILTDLIGKYSGYPVGVRLALPVALVLGIVGEQAVALLIPIAKRWFVSKASLAAGEAQQP